MTVSFKTEECRNCPLMIPLLCERCKDNWRNGRSKLCLKCLKEKRAEKDKRIRLKRYLKTSNQGLQPKGGR